MLPTPELEIARNLPAENCTPVEAERYTRWLATHHYENFNVVSWLLPRELHQHFYNVYAYCRWSDDLGDEVADSARALQLLDAWEDELRLIYAEGSGPAHPVLIALGGTIRAKNIPITPFSDLLRAFRQDQTVKRYATWAEVFDYCVYSANPVGRLVLYLCDYRDLARQKMSDATCTALQLANFWQDVLRDLEKGRIYIPIEALAAFGLTADDIVGKRFDERYVALMKSLIARARELFDAGRPLAKTVRPFLRTDLEMFTRGGLAILDAIESSGYNTLEHRPSLGKLTQAKLLVQTLAVTTFARLSRESVPESKNGASGVKTPDGEVNVMSELKLRPPKELGASNEFRSDNEATSEPRPVDGAISANVLRVETPDEGRGVVSVGSYSDSVRDSYAECNRIARASKSSFYYAFFGLRKEKRNALCALYAFMRLIDDVSDEPGDLESKRQGLARWRAMLDDAVDGRTGGHAVLPALADTIARFEIPTRYFHDLILGAEMDLTVSTYATFDRLSEYCYRVAGTVGLTCLHVFGFSDPKAPDLAERLGLAFQLTNIIRDVGADYAIGRIYLPQEDLDRFGVRAEELGGPVTPKLQELLLFEADRAWQMYQEGAPLVKKINGDSRATLWALVRTYSTLLARIEEREFDVFSSRISTSSAEKIQFLLTAGMTGWWKKDALAKRSGDRRRLGGTVVRRRAG
jgi:squalene synthase HpnC/squalene synthase HpnD